VAGIASRDCAGTREIGRGNDRIGGRSRAHHRCGRRAHATDLRAGQANLRGAALGDDTTAITVTIGIGDELYFRVDVVELKVPALADRADDVLPLAKAILAELASALDLAPVVGSVALELAEDARAALSAYRWPGNVRELANRLRRAVLLADGGLVRAKDLALGEALGARPRGPTSSRESEGEPASLDRGSIEAALERAEWKISRAAANLGLSRQALYRRMEKLGVSLERRVRGSE